MRNSSIDEVGCVPSCFIIFLVRMIGKRNTIVLPSSVLLGNGILIFYHLSSEACLERGTGAQQVCLPKCQIPSTQQLSNHNISGVTAGILKKFKASSLLFLYGHIETPVIVLGEGGPVVQVHFHYHYYCASCFVQSVC